MILDEITRIFIREHRTSDVRQLALQARKYPEVDMTEAVTQIAGWQVAREKIPAWASVEGICYPMHLSMEQCSSEETAKYKQEVIATTAAVSGDYPSVTSSPSNTLFGSFTDLTGGFGIDCAFLAVAFKKAAYVERQTSLSLLARHNFPLLGLEHIEVHNTDAVEYLQAMQPVEWLFLDPARRDHRGGKTVAITDCEPDVSALEQLLLQKAEHVLIKLSPMLDLSLAMNDLKQVQAVHIVSVGNECKELLLVLGNESLLHPDDVPIHCINLQQGGAIQRLIFTKREEQESVCTYAHAPKTYLYEPNASVLKGGAYRALTHIYKVEKLHPNSHLYTSDDYLPDFPGRKFCVEAFGGFGKREMKMLLGEDKKANLTVRNFPASVAELRKRLRLAEGGEIYLFATTLKDERKVLIRCKAAIHNL